MRMPWSQLRLMVYSFVGIALLITAALVKRAPVERAPRLLLIVLSLLAGALALIVIIDVAYHAWRGQGQACPYCGHVRKMKPFRVYLACPKCGR
ncbi:MAG: hypothetical protein ACYC6N_32680 [Pirellulaceae bacterium]